MQLQKKLQRLALFATTLVSTTGALMLQGLTSPAYAALKTAKRADAFVDSIGINLHLTYPNTAYANYSGLVKPRLQELGVRHIRDNSYNYNDGTYFNKLKDLSSIGIKSNLFFQGQDPKDVVSIAKSLTGTIEAVEGPNETDLTYFNNFTYKGQKFPQSTRAYQNDFYAAIKNDPLTAYLPVVLPSVGWGKNSEQVGYVGAGDVGNMHSYPNLGDPPTIDIDWWYIPYARIIAGDLKPLWSTETGYGTLPNHDLGVSETVAAKYLPRLLLEHFNRDVKRVYLYQLVDPLPNSGIIYDHTGLLRNNGSVKPAYTAIKNLIDILKDSTDSFTPGNLDYSLSDSAGDIHSTLLQKKNGIFYLILWQEVKSWDAQNNRNIDVQERPLTLNSAVCKAEAYRPYDSVSPVALNVAGDKMHLRIPDHPLIVKLVPKGNAGC